MESQETGLQRTASALHVLVVDDNSDAADTLCVLLRMWGHDCRVAYDGETGFRVARDYHPDCLLLDLAMPRMDGCTLARKLRTQPDLENAKLIALTVHVGEPFVRLAWDAGFDDYFPKPTDVADVKRLKELLSAIAPPAARTQEVARE